MQINIDIQDMETMESISETLQVDNLYKEVAERLKEISPGKAGQQVTVTNNKYTVMYMIVNRSGTQFITEIMNSFPEQKSNFSEKYLTCVIPEKNSYKYYKLVPKNNEVIASWGRMGEGKESKYTYPKSMFWIKYYEKIGKGYVDRTEQYVDSVVKDVAQTTASTPDTVSGKLYAKLKSWAKQAVHRANVKAPLNQKLIEASKVELAKMRNAVTIDAFNKALLDLMCLLQRPIYTGDGQGVNRMLAKSKYDFSEIIIRETDLIDAMEGLVNNKVVEESFEGYNIEVYKATTVQKEQVMKNLSDHLKPKVKNVYRIIPKEQKRRFDHYCKKNKIKTVKQLWHGSRNENWLSITKNGLCLNPNAIITGKMFGQGIYFAPSSMKSWNYTSYRGTSWANGKADTAFMGLYAVAYGNPHDCDSAYPYTKKWLQDHKCDCVHAHAGVQLKNDEIIFYDEDAILLQYIVEFK